MVSAVRDRDLYSKLLGITSPWTVSDVRLEEKERQVEVHLEHGGEGVPCPECGQSCGRYDTTERRWRHLDTMQFRTILVAAVPRANCSDHGVHQVKVPWAEPGARFTAMFEALTIDWLQETSISGVSRMLGLTWREVDGIMTRAVCRGLARRKLELPTQLGVDETSFQKRHEYVTIVNDLVDKKVLHVADGRSRESLGSFYRQFSSEELAGLDAIAMDMCGAYIAVTHDMVPGADEKIAFDKFHVASHLGGAVDKVRRAENAGLRLEGNNTLKGTKYLWLTNPANLSERQGVALDTLISIVKRTARAWAIKEHAMDLWTFRDRGAARRAWLRWYGWAIRSRLEPVKKVARMVKKHLDGILNAIMSGMTNAKAESTNATVQWVKATACGFRNRERFRNAIYFHLGGLDLYPATLRR
jgi:transposase